MVSKNNQHLYDEKMNRTHFRYSLRKLNVGVASVLLGIGFGYGFVANQTGAAAAEVQPTDQPAPTAGANTGNNGNQTPATNQGTTGTTTGTIANPKVPTPGSNQGQAIPADAITQGYVTSATDLTNAKHTISGHAYITDSGTLDNTPGNGLTPVPDGKKVYLQWMDADGAVSPTYEAAIHSNLKLITGNGGAGTFAFNLSSSRKDHIVNDGWTDASGKMHVFDAKRTQYFRMWMNDYQAPDGNTLTMFRQGPGYFPGAWNKVTALMLASPLYGTNMQKASLYMYELPPLDKNGSYLTPKRSQWIDSGNVDNPGMTVSGEAWISSGSALTQGPLRNSDPGAKDYTVVASVLTPEGITAYKQEVAKLSKEEQPAAAKRLLQQHPRYVAQTSYAKVAQDGSYKINFTSDAVPDPAEQRYYLYMFIENKDGEVQTAYSPWTTTLFRGPNDSGVSQIKAQSAVSLWRPLKHEWQFVNFAVIPSEMPKLEITNHDTKNKPAKYGNTAKLAITGSVPDMAQDKKITWTATGSNLKVEIPFSKIAEINNTGVANPTISKDGKSIIFNKYKDNTGKPLTVPFTDAKGDPIPVPNGTVFTASLTAGDTQIAESASFKVVTTPDSQKYQPEPTEIPGTTKQTLADLDPKTGIKDLLESKPDGTTDKLDNTTTPKMDDLIKSVTWYDPATDAAEWKKSMTGQAAPTNPTGNLKTSDQFAWAKVTYKDGSVDFAKIPLKITDTPKQADGYTPETKPIEVAKDTPTVPAATGIKDYLKDGTKETTTTFPDPNNKDTPTAPKVTWDHPTDPKSPETSVPTEVNVNKPGVYDDVPATVTYPDGSKDPVKETVVVGNVIDVTKNDKHNDPNVPNAIPDGYELVTVNATNGHFGTDTTATMKKYLVKDKTPKADFLAEVAAKANDGYDQKTETWSPELPATFNKDDANKNYTVTYYKAPATKQITTDPGKLPTDPATGISNMPKDGTTNPTDNLPTGTTVTWQNPTDAKKQIDDATPGTTVEIPATIHYQNGKTEDVNIPVMIKAPGDDVAYQPTYAPTTAKQGVDTKTGKPTYPASADGKLNAGGKAPADTHYAKDPATPAWVKSVDPDTGEVTLSPTTATTPGAYNVPVMVNYPDKTSETVFVPVIVTTGDQAVTWGDHGAVVTTVDPTKLAAHETSDHSQVLNPADAVTAKGYQLKDGKLSETATPIQVNPAKVTWAKAPDTNVTTATKDGKPLEGLQANVDLKDNQAAKDLLGTKDGVVTTAPFTITAKGAGAKPTVDKKVAVPVNVKQGEKLSDAQFTGLIDNNIPKEQIKDVTWGTVPNANGENGVVKITFTDNNNDGQPTYLNINVPASSLHMTSDQESYEPETKPNLADKGTTSIPAVNGIKNAPGSGQPGELPTSTTVTWDHPQPGQDPETGIPVGVDPNKPGVYDDIPVTVHYPDGTKDNPTETVVVGNVIDVTNNDKHNQPNDDQNPNRVPDGYELVTVSAKNGHFGTDTTATTKKYLVKDGTTAADFVKALDPRANDGFSQDNPTWTPALPAQFARDSLKSYEVTFNPNAKPTTPQPVAQPDKDLFQPSYDPTTVQQGGTQTVTPKYKPSADGKVNAGKVPEGTKYTPGANVPDWVTVAQDGTVTLKPTDKTPTGPINIPVVVTYPDGTPDKPDQETVYVPVIVTDKAGHQTVTWGDNGAVVATVDTSKLGAHETSDHSQVLDPAAAITLTGYQKQADGQIATTPMPIKVDPTKVAWATAPDTTVPEATLAGKQLPGQQITVDLTDNQATKDLLGKQNGKVTTAPFEVDAAGAAAKTGVKTPVEVKLGSALTPDQFTALVDSKLPEGSVASTTWAMKPDEMGNGGVIKITFNDDYAKDTPTYLNVKVPAESLKMITDANTNTPDTKPNQVAQGAKMIPAENGISNMPGTKDKHADPELPVGTTVEWNDPKDGKPLPKDAMPIDPATGNPIMTDKPGIYDNVPATVNYPDGTKDRVTETVIVGNVIDVTNNDKHNQPNDGQNPNRVPEGYVLETFKVVNGTFAPDGTQAASTTKVLLVKSGTPVNEVLAQVKPMANPGYGNGSWDNLPAAEFTATGTHTYTFMANKPVTQPLTTDPGKLPSAPDGIKNLGDLPKDTKVDWTNPGEAQKLVDMTKPGETVQIPAMVTYPDGSKEQVMIPVTINVPAGPAKMADQMTPMVKPVTVTPGAKPMMAATKMAPAKKAAAKKLPQTGDQHEQGAAIAGLAMTTALLGLFGLKKKQER